MTTMETNRLIHGVSNWNVGRRADIALECTNREIGAGSCVFGFVQLLTKLPYRSPPLVVRSAINFHAQETTVHDAGAI